MNYRPWAATGLNHDLEEGGASAFAVTFALGAHWPFWVALTAAILMSPGIPIVKAINHRRSGDKWPHILKDGAWELLVWGAGWWVLYRGITIDALGTLILWWIALTFLRRYTKLGSP